MKKYYYLRPGDFRPEELDETAYRALDYPTNEIARTELLRAGNLFKSWEEANGASLRVRNLLRKIMAAKEPEECSLQHHKPADNTQQLFRPSAPQKHSEEKASPLGEPQSAASTKRQDVRSIKSHPKTMV